MRSLEPREEAAGVVLINELEDVNEVICFTHGTYEIGYDFNGEEQFKIRFKNSNMIGAFNLSFNQRSEYIYRTVTNCQGFFIRKRAWYDIMNNHKQVSEGFKAQIAQDYELYINRRLTLHKLLDIKRAQSRSDVQQYKFVLS